MLGQFYIYSYMHLTHIYISQLVPRKYFYPNCAMNASMSYCRNRHLSASCLRKHPRQRKYRARSLELEMERDGPGEVVYAFSLSLGSGNNRNEKSQVSRICVEKLSKDQCDLFSPRKVYSDDILQK